MLPHSDSSAPSEDGSSDDTRLEHGLEPPSWIDLPSKLGRYLLTERLGRGGTGAVFRAHDPELARDVAIKVVRSRSNSDRARQNLLGEAQAIAKLSHPNVVAVHDVGELPEREDRTHGVYMVMELLPGATLREWLRRGPHPFAQVLDVLVAAGRGLEAAHRAGLVHRDIKPDNLVIGENDDGSLRVHVVDFGLALAGAASMPEGFDTQTSGVVEVAGTPAYMAPEQHQGESSDVRTDLFAFCVTAWEAIHGKQPYRGRTLGEIARAKQAGPPRPPTRRAPSWLDDLLASGLATDPARRPTSMTALLSTIERRRHRRRNFAIAALSLTVVGGAMTWAWRSGADARECIEQGETRLGGIWNDEVRQGAKERFDAVDLPYAADAWSRAATVLDQRATAWRDARKQSCEAALDGGAAAVEQSAAALGCLDAYLDEFAARVDVIAVADHEIVVRAARMAERMSPPERCLDARWVAEERSVDGGGELEADLMKARLEHELGHFDEAARGSAKVVAAAEAAGDLRRLARATLQLCRAEGSIARGMAAPASCTDAWVAAERASTDSIAVGALLELLRRTRLTEELDQAKLYERLVRARMTNLDETSRMPFESDLELILSQRHREMGRWHDARAEAQRAYDLMVEVRGANDPAVVPALNELALDAEELGEISLARQLFEQAATIMIEARGTSHPDVVSLENNIAGLEMSLGQHEQALERLARVRAAKQALDGPRTPWQLTTMYQAVEALTALGRGAEALALAREELALAESVHGTDSSELLASLRSLLAGLRAAGQCGEALQVQDRIAAIVTRAEVRETEYDASVTLERARCLDATGRSADAGPAYRDALAKLEQLYGGDARPVAEALLALAEWEDAHGSAEVATASLERARAMCQRTEGDPALARRIDEAIARRAR